MSLPSWAQWSIIAAVSLLSPALAFLLVVAVLLGLLKEDVAAAFLAIVVTCTVANLLVRRVRAAPGVRALVAPDPARRGAAEVRRLSRATAR